MLVFIDMNKTAVLSIGSLVFLLVILLIFAVTEQQKTEYENDKHVESSDVSELPAVEDINTDTFYVTAVIDGDTFKTKNGETVRLIGVNSPERGQAYYVEAKDWLTEHILKQNVSLEKDVDDRDRYGRLLSYVYIGDVFINEELVLAGLAKSYTYEPNTSKQSILNTAEEAAYNNQSGMWTLGSGNQAISVVSFNYDSPGPDNKSMEEEYFTLLNSSNSGINLSGYSVSDSANNEYVFPNFVLDKEGLVSVRTGNGTDSDTDLYWRSNDPVWNNGGDTLYLRDSDGQIVLTYSY